MSVPAMITHLLLEKLARHPLPRVPESEDWIETWGQITAFAEGGRNEGILIHLYLLHAIMAMPVIRPGDIVLDLACGPANQLAYMAALNPDAAFIGLDASKGMLDIAEKTLADSSINNVSLVFGDMTRLAQLDIPPIDCVVCTMSLHHLPTAQALAQTINQINGILKSDGGIFFSDFGRLKRQATQYYFAHDRIELQSQAFTDDFLCSMQAAFSLEELDEATHQLKVPITLYPTALAPFMVLGRSKTRREMDAAARARAMKGYQQLNKLQQRDFDNMARWLKLSGLVLPCLVS